MKTIVLSLVLACYLTLQASAQYQWNKLDMYGTNAYKILVDTDGSILAATSSGLYRSADNGEHWTRSQKSFLSSISFDPSFTNIRETFDFAGNNYVTARAYINGWHYYSTDHGITWQAVSDSLEYIEKGITTRLTTQKNTLLIGVYDSGIRRSTDNGATSEKVLSTTYNTPAVLTQTSSGTLFAGGEYGGVFSSSDDGMTWKEYTVPGTGSIDNKKTQLLVRDKELLVLAGKSLYRSTDGVQWAETPLSYSVFIGTPILSPDGDIVTLVTDEQDVEYIGRLPKDGTHLIISGQEVPYFPLYNIAAGAHSWFVAAQGGIHRSLDQGATWQKSDGDIYNLIFSVLSLKDGSTLINNIYDLCRYEGSAPAVTSLRAHLPTYIGEMNKMTTTKKGTILITAAKEGLYRSTDQGATFENIPFSESVGGIYTRSNGDILATIGTKGLLISQDDGKTWETFIEFPMNIQTISTLDDVTESRDGAFFVSSSEGYIIRIDANLTDASVLTGPNTGHPGFSLLLVKDDIYIVDNFSHLLRGKFANQTVTWADITPPDFINKGGLYNLIIGPSGDIFCSTDLGLYRTHDRGTTWEVAGWQDNIVKRVCIDDRGRLYVNVLNKGNYVAQLPTGVSEQPSALLRMADIVPNPAFDHTQLHFTTSHPAQVQVLLYNTLGQEVMVAANTFKPAGEQTVSINTALLSPGLYKYRVQAGSEMLTGNLTVAR